MAIEVRSFPVKDGGAARDFRGLLKDRGFAAEAAAIQGSLALPVGHEEYTWSTEDPEHLLGGGSVGSGRVRRRGR